MKTIPTLPKSLIAFLVLAGGVTVFAQPPGWRADDDHPATIGRGYAYAEARTNAAARTSRAPRFYVGDDRIDIWSEFDKSRFPHSAVWSWWDWPIANARARAESDAGDAAEADSRVASAEPETKQPSHLPTKQTYLGMALSPPDPLLSAHVSDSLPSGQGLAVRGIESKSVAEAIGFKLHDVLLRLNAQTVSTVHELVGISNEVKPQRHLTFEILRAGKVMRLEAEADSVPTIEWPEYAETGRSAIAQSFSNELVTVAITSDDGVQFKVEVSYRTASLAKRSHSFVGTLDGIHNHLVDLPADVAQLVAERLHLATSSRVTEKHFSDEPRLGAVSMSYGDDRLQLALNSSDGVRFNLDISYSDARGVRHQLQLAGAASNLAAQVRARLPDDISAIVLKQLEQAGGLLS